MKKKQQLLKCPHCQEFAVALCQDAIIPFKLKTLKNGKIQASKIIESDINYLDNMWLECKSCHECSDNGDNSGTDELNALFDLID